MSVNLIDICGGCFHEQTLLLGAQLNMITEPL